MTRIALKEELQARETNLSLFALPLFSRSISISISGPISNYIRHLTPASAPHSRKDGRLGY